jgi:hypothetical protein
MSSTSTLTVRLKRLSDPALVESTRVAVRKERNATTEVLHHFIDVENRRLYADRHSSLYAWAMEELGYTEGAALRRMNSSRILRRHPHLEQTIESGKICLTQLSYVRHFFRQEKKHGKPYSLEQERELLTAIEGQSTRKTLRYLTERSSAPEKLSPKNDTRPAKNGKTELRLILNQEAMIDLNRLKELWSHAVPDGDLAEIIARAAKVTLEKIDPIKKAERSIQRKEKKVDRRLAKHAASQKKQQDIAQIDQHPAVQQKVNLPAAPKAQHPSELDMRHSSNVTSSATSMVALDTSTRVLDSAIPASAASSLASDTTTTNVSATSNATASAGGRQSSLPIIFSMEIFDEVDPETGERQICLPLLWHTRYIPADVKHAVWIRDGGQCTYIDRDGRCCSSRHQLEFEHVIPFAHGGENTGDNIRILCRCHNSLMADQVFG